MNTNAPLQARAHIALLEKVAAENGIQTKLSNIGKSSIAFEHVCEGAVAFVCALVTYQSHKRVWVICETVRVQEQLHNELLNWFPHAELFPKAEISPAEGALPDPDITAERLEILHGLLGSKNAQEPGLLVITRESLSEQVPAPAALQQATLEIAVGNRLDRDELAKSLQKAGFERVAQVSLRGQFAVRGGILDIFSWQQTLPIRIELFDDLVESIRAFDLDSQTSIEHLRSCSILLAEQTQNTCPLADYIRGDLTVAAHLQEHVECDIQICEGAASGDATEDYSSAFFEHGLGEFDAGDLIIEESKRERFFDQLREWRLAGWQTYIFCSTEGQIERFQELIPPVEVDAIEFSLGVLNRGFTFPAAKLALLSDSELFGRYRNSPARRLALRRAREQANRSQIDFSELNEGDYVVHLEHGIALYHGLQNFSLGDGKAEEVLVLEFAANARLYVPLEQSHLVSRYVGVGRKHPALSALGDGKWSKAKKTAEQAAYDYAATLLRLHAERQSIKGHAFIPDNKWQQEFERSFRFKETPDQLSAIAATKTDMESERPMDRLICGDVGFGKTEVAIRAAFKAVMGGKQVALLVPTTVLAQQHFLNFRERMSDYPVHIDMLSRFRTAAEQRKTLKGLADGSIDIVVGTHRLISKDVQFANLGLVVIDEEQRFGVLHKEKFKILFRQVDVLTLSATPIPRTLYLSLMGARDMSTIETPPQNRIPVETTICPYDERIIRDAINRELARQGQVYFLHNRIHSIEHIRARIRALCPKARVEIGHGQMDEEELEAIMQRFVNGETDVLISTTIIESGLDIPNANTIIIDRADRFGLADLYQLRGRVGRSLHKAYAFLLLPRDMMTRGGARKRINAIKQYSSLGAGFKIAMRDLEIRGAGNILGTRQSGHIVAIGFDLYCKLLKQAIARLRGESSKPRLEVAISLDFVCTSEAEYNSVERKNIHLAPAFLPAGYMAESKTRIQSYRKLAEVDSHEQLEALSNSWRDRFGPLPEMVENLLLMTEMRLAALERKVTKVEVRQSKLMLTRGGDYLLIGDKFPRLTTLTPEEQLSQAVELIRTLIPTGAPKR